MTHGRSLAGLAPSSYQAMLHFYIDSDYPVGVFLPLGIGHVLTGQDSLWLYQPYLAVLAVMLSLALYEIAGGVWLAPLLVPAAYVLVRRGWEVAGRSAGIFAAMAIPLAIPSLLLVSFLSEPAASTITTQSRLANLIQPLSPFQAVGIWPVDDFRLRTPHSAVTALFIAFAIVVALFGVYAAWRRRAWAPLLYIGGVGLAGAGVYLAASPWVDAKALAITSPAVLLAAAAGVSALVDARQAIPAALLAVALAGGVLWSNVLAYGGVNLGPRGRLAELEHIGNDIAGEGPTLMTDYEPYGVRHLLRDGDPEGASELRRRQIPLRNGQLLEKGESADVDQFDTNALLVYRTLVLRRSPVGSRPPAPYHLVSSGHWYDVWQRDTDASPRVTTHLSLGDDVNSGAVPKCSDVLALAAQAGSGGRLAAVRSSPADLITLRSMRYPRSWDAPTPGVNYVLPNSSGTATTATTLFPGGPIVLSRETADRPFFYVPASDARSLCGQRLDWVEAVS